MTPTFAFPFVPENTSIHSIHNRKCCLSIFASQKLLEINTNPRYVIYFNPNLHWKFHVCGIQTIQTTVYLWSICGCFRNEKGNFSVFCLIKQPISSRSSNIFERFSWLTDWLRDLSFGTLPVRMRQWHGICGKYNKTHHQSKCFNRIPFAF